MLGILNIFPLVLLSIFPGTSPHRAVGKNKRLSKGKKGIKKKVVDPFSRKGRFLARRNQVGAHDRDVLFLWYSLLFSLKQFNLPLRVIHSFVPPLEIPRRLVEWYDIKAPSFFENRNAGKTLVNRSQGLSEFDGPSFYWVRLLTSSIENANDSLKGRIIELSLADLNNDQEQSFRKIKLRVEDVSVRKR